MGHQLRGFNNTTANKLLVMIDGRTVYTPLFAGVFWDVQDVLLEDVDRIEVISGPGGTLWGPTPSERGHQCYLQERTRPSTAPGRRRLRA